MNESKHNWAILIATFTFPVAAIALLLAIRAGSSERRPAHPPPRPRAPGPPFAGPFHGPGHKGPFQRGMGHMPFHGGPVHPAPFHGGPPMPPPDQVQGLRMMSRQIGLSEPQLKQVEKIFTEAGQRRKALDTEMEKAQQKLHSLLDDPNAKEPQIKQAMALLHKLKGEAMELWVLTPWRIRAVLTPEQRKKLAELTLPLGPLGHARHRGLLPPMHPPFSPGPSAGHPPFPPGHGPMGFPPGPKGPGHGPPMGFPPGPGNLGRGPHPHP